MAGRIDQVELIHLAVFGAIVQAHGVGLDGDAALALQVHRVQHLRHHFALGKGAGEFEQTIGERRLTVVDVRNDTEITDKRGSIRGMMKLLQRRNLDYPTSAQVPVRCFTRFVSGD